MRGAVAESILQVVGRERELGRLRGFLDADRFPRALVLSGGPGIGKTTLWEAVVAEAPRLGFRVLSTRASSSEAQLSFGGLMDLLDGVDIGALDGLPVPQARALEVVLLRADSRGAAPEQGAIALGFLNALRTLTASDPILLAVDDVQWLDSPSMDVLSFVTRRLEENAVGFLLTRRPGRVFDIERVLEPTLERLEVGPLSLGAVRHLLSERLGLSLPRHVLRRLVEATLGNPLFALEVGRVLAEHGLPAVAEGLPVPDAVEDLLGTRVVRLRPPSRRLLLAVALSADLRTADLERFADAAAVEDAVETGLLIVEGNRVRASHPLLAAAARKRSTARERRELHLELAGVVADRGLRARHLALGTAYPDAALSATVAAAAAGAAARGAAHDAAELAEHALRLTPTESADRNDRLLALAGYLQVAGEPQRATDLLAPGIDRLPAGSARARAHLLLAESRFAVSHVDESGDHLERALAESEGDPALRATVMARRSRFSAVVRVERIREAEAWALEVLPAALAAGADVEREVLYALAWARNLRGRPIDDLCERFRAVSEDASHIFRSLDRVAAARFTNRGERRQARTTLSRLLALADNLGQEWSYVILRLQLCELELLAGEWEAAGQLLDEWDQSPDRGLVATPAYERCRALLEVGLGHPEEAERWAARALAGSEASGLRWDRLEALWVRGMAALLMHEPVRAVESLRIVWEHTKREGVADPGVFPVAPDLVEWLVEVDAGDEARAVTARLCRLSEEQTHPWGLTTSKRCAALVQLASGAYDEEAAGMLQQAAAEYGGLGLRFDRARSLLIVGRAQRRHRKWAAARRSLEGAVAAFEELGSPGWAEEARSQLARVGGRPRRAAGELTPTERRVAELASGGLSNKEIAHALVVTVNTVEAHLSRAYAKLGVHRRAQLATCLFPDTDA